MLHNLPFNWYNSVTCIYIRIPGTFSLDLGSLVSAGRHTVDKGFRISDRSIACLARVRYSDIVQIYIPADDQTSLTREILVSVAVSWIDPIRIMSRSRQRIRYNRV